MKRTTTRSASFLLAAAMMIAPFAANADETSLVPRKVPAKTLQVPTADVSPGLQKLIAAPLNPAWNNQFRLLLGSGVVDLSSRSVGHLV